MWNTPENIYSDCCLGGFLCLRSLLVAGIVFCPKMAALSQFGFRSEGEVRVLLQVLLRAAQARVKC